MKNIDSNLLELMHPNYQSFCQSNYLIFTLCIYSKNITLFKTLFEVFSLFAFLASVKLLHTMYIHTHTHIHFLCFKIEVNILLIAEVTPNSIWQD